MLLSELAVSQWPEEEAEGTATADAFLITCAFLQSSPSLSKWRTRRRFVVRSCLVPPSVDVVCSGGVAGIDGCGLPLLWLVYIVLDGHVTLLPGHSSKQNLLLLVILNLMGNFRREVGERPLL